MVVGNKGETPLYNGKGANLHSPRSCSSGQQQQLQMQFDAWMNNLNIARVPENVSKQMLEKGKAKAVSDTSGVTETTLDNTKSSIPIPTSRPMQQLGGSVQETQSSSTQLEHNQGAPEIENSTSPMSSTRPKDKTYGQTYVPSQQVKSNASSGKFENESSNFAQNYQFDNPQSFNFAEGNSYQGIPMQTETSKTSSEDPNLMQNTQLPNMVFNNNGNSNKEGNHEGSNGNNDSYNRNNENNNMNEDVTIVSSPPSVQVPPSSSGVPSDLNDIFPSLEPWGVDVPWTQQIQDTPIWEWDDLFFP